jgi:hypothetical protein
MELLNSIFTMEFTVKTVFGLIITFFGYLDAWKYYIEARKIAYVKSSRGHSRKFINIAIANDLIRLVYFLTIDRNLYLLISCLFALIFMGMMFWQIYLWYPYRKRGLNNFKRPNILIYTINSLMPNSLRKRL